MGNVFSIEALEERRMLAVTAATLAASLAKGTTWTYKVTSGKTVSTVTNTVVGPAKVGKISTTEIDSTVKTGGTSATTQSFFNLSSKNGLLIYKVSAKSTVSGFSTTIVTAPNPYDVVYPAKLEAGKTYSFKWNDVITTTVPFLGNTKTTSSIAYSVKLVSDKLTKVTVPAGTFSCYQIQTTTKTTVNGKTSSSTQTNYVAPNVGEVKTVVGKTTNVLTKYVKGK